MGKLLSFAPLPRGERCEKQKVKPKEPNNKNQINLKIRNPQISYKHI